MFPSKGQEYHATTKGQRRLWVRVATEGSPEPGPRGGREGHLPRCHPGQSPRSRPRSRCSSVFPDPAWSTMGMFTQVAWRTWIPRRQSPHVGRWRWGGGMCAHAEGSGLDTRGGALGWHWPGVRTGLRAPPGDCGRGRHPVLGPGLRPSGNCQCDLDLEGTG